MSLWLTAGMEGGAGGDWGQRIGSEYFLSALDNPHIWLHEFGHTMALDDFYDWTPTGITNFIMLAGSSQTVTDFDIWMMRDFWRHLSSRYVTPDAAAPVATTSSIRATSAVTTSVPPTLAFSTASVATTLKTTIKTTITTLATSIKTTTKVASTAAPTTLKTTTVAVRTTSSPLPAATGGVGAPLYGQCGGNGWAGPRTCVSGTCKFNNDWYSQCI